MAKIKIAQESIKEFAGLGGRPQLKPNPYETPKVDATARALDFTYHVRSTPTEEHFTKLLIRRLQASAFNGEVGAQEIIPIKLNAKLRSELIKVHPTYKDKDFVLRRPDLIIYNVGLIIELDGKVHDNFDHRIQRDNAREYEYRSLGFELYRVGTDQLKNIDVLLNDICLFIHAAQSNPDYLKKYQKRRTAVSRARASFKATGSSFDIGSFRKKSEIVNVPDITVPGQRQFGGIRWSINTSAKHL